MIAYHERIASDSRSRERVGKSRRALEWLQPLLQRLEQEETDRRDEADRLRRINMASPPASSFEGQLQRRVREKDEPEYETVWSGGEGLTSYQRGGSP